MVVASDQYGGHFHFESHLDRRTGYVVIICGLKTVVVVFFRRSLFPLVFLVGLHNRMWTLGKRVCVICVLFKDNSLDLDFCIRHCCKSIYCCWLFVCVICTLPHRHPCFMCVFYRYPGRILKVISCATRIGQFVLSWNPIGRRNFRANQRAGFY